MCTVKSGFGGGLGNHDCCVFRPSANDREGAIIFASVTFSCLVVYVILGLSSYA